MLTGEYLVLDGAVALALPTQLGQSMRVKESAGSEISWKSHDWHGNIWFEGKFDLMAFEPMKSSDDKIAETLQHLLTQACRLNSDFLSKWKKYQVHTYLEFDRSWGLGSSSSLIRCLATWADVNPYHLLFNTMGGSGYDVACAGADGPILYQLSEDSLEIHAVDFLPAFTDRLYFLYLGQKQDSSEARKHYYKHRKSANGAIQEVSGISRKLIEANTLQVFMDLLREHERIISAILKLPTVQETRFPDFPGLVKSLGAWGGDFALVASDLPMEKVKAYFREKKLKTLFPFDELILQPASALSKA